MMMMMITCMCIMDQIKGKFTLNKAFIYNLPGARGIEFGCKVRKFPCPVVPLQTQFISKLQKPDSNFCRLRFQLLFSVSSHVRWTCVHSIAQIACFFTTNCSFWLERKRKRRRLWPIALFPICVFILKRQHEWQRLKKNFSFTFAPI